MLKTARRLAVCFTITFGFMLAASAQDTVVKTDAAGNLIVVYDSSNSMWGELADRSRKYEAGRSALSKFMATDLSGRNIALRAYGHRHKDDCRDSELIVPFGSAAENKTSIASAVTSIRPTGKTPITYSLTESLKDLGGKSGNILLISDGIETCDADPCELMREWNASSVNIQVHVVGVGLNNVERTAMACIAEESGGKYFDADTTEGFEEALNEVAETIEVVQAEPGPAEHTGSIGIRINAIDSEGRAYRSSGKLFKDGVEIGTVVSAGYGRNVVDGPGDYEIEIGALLRDGSTYRPVRKNVTVEAGSDTKITVVVEAPARVNATFNEDGNRHSGAYVTAWQDGEEVFGFRAKDEALAAPGAYEFRSAPNKDNAVSATANLTAGALTTIEFELIETVKAYVQFQLNDGKVIRRASELWRDGEKVYSILSSNGGTIRPGTYELRSNDQNAPLTPTEITIDGTEGKTYIVPLDVGWIRILFPEETSNYIKSRVPNRATLLSLDRGGSKYSRPGTLIPVSPGRYAVAGFDGDGFFDRPEVNVESGKAVDVTVTPELLGELIMTYAPSENYKRDPDRGSAAALDGQRIVGGILRPGDVRKFYPGRYRITGYSYVGDIPHQDVTVAAGKRTEVVLKLRGE